MDDLRDNNGIEESLRDKKPGSMPSIGNSIRNNNGIENSLRKKQEQKSVSAEVEELKGRVQSQQTAAVDMAATVEQAAGASAGRIDFSNVGATNHVWNKPPKGKWRKLYTDITYDKETGKLKLTKREAFVQTRAFDPDEPEEIEIEAGGGTGIPDGAEAWGKVEVVEKKDEYPHNDKTIGYEIYQHKQMWSATQGAFVDKPNSKVLVYTLPAGGSGTTYVPGEPKLVEESGTIYERAMWCMVTVGSDGVPSLTETDNVAWQHEVKTHADDHTDGVL